LAKDVWNPHYPSRCRWENMAFREEGEKNWGERSNKDKGDVAYFS